MDLTELGWARQTYHTESDLRRWILDFMEVVATTAAAVANYPLACITGNAFPRTQTASKYFLEPGNTKHKHTHWCYQIYRISVRLLRTLDWNWMYTVSQTVVSWHSWWPHNTVFTANIEQLPLNLKCRFGRPKRSYTGLLPAVGVAICRETEWRTVGSMMFLCATPFQIHCTAILAYVYCVCFLKTFQF